MITRVCVSVCLCVCLSVCLSLAACPHYCIDPDVTCGSGRGCPLVVHYWADLQSVHRLRCYGNITRTRNVSEKMLVLALCIVTLVSLLSVLPPPTTGGTKYCSLRVCMSILLCISVCPLAYLKTTCPNFTKFYVRVTSDRGQYNMLCTSSFVDDSIFMVALWNRADHYIFIL